MADLPDFPGLSHRPAGRFRESWAATLVLAGLLTVLNSLKPLHIDDTAYHGLAEQMSRAPLDPYGFEQFWYDRPEPANHVLAPPVLPYWWSLGITLFGDRPTLWKLWLFPFAWLFVTSLVRIYRRFARGVELPLAWMTVVSPMFLPSLNLMLDVPAVALGLTALDLFFRSSDREHPWAGVLGAGLVAGLAVQTKYSAAAVPAVMLAWSASRGRWVSGLAAGLTAAAVFWAWELFVSVRYGESHFVYHLFAPPHDPNEPKLSMVLPFVTILGGAAPCLAALVLAAAGARRSVIVTTLAVLWAGYAVLWLVPTGLTVLLANPHTADDQLSFRHLFFGVNGGLAVGGVVMAVGRLRSRRQSVRGRAVDRFLWAWLVLETLAAFALSPFAAVRRLMGVVVVGTLVIGRLASRTCRTSTRRVLLWWVAAGSAGIGGLFWCVDFMESEVMRRAVAETATLIRARDHRPRPPVWFVGHWGFQYYATRAGFTPVVPGESVLRPGDWFVDPEFVHQQRIAFLEDAYAPAPAEFQRDWDDPVWLRTVPCFYAGKNPLRHRDDGRFSVRVYRVTKLHTPPVP